MKRLIYFIPALLVAGGANAQTSYNNFVGKSKEKTVVMSAGDVKNITVNPDTPNTIDVNLADGTKNTMELGDEGDARFIKVSTEKLLGELYGYQYYGLPYSSNRTTKVSASNYTGKFDALTDLYQLHWDKIAVNTKYYGGTLNADSIPLYAYNSEMMWESVIKANELIKNINSLSEEEAPDKDKIAAEAKCIIAMHYFDMFMHYGGLPIVTDVIPSANWIMGNNITGPSVELIEKADIPGIHNRKSVAETVDYMVALLDEAIPYLDWEQSDIMTFQAERLLYGAGSAIGIETLRWNKAAAMALKAKILLFAASPFFNDNQPYLQTMTEEQKPLVWYGGYDSVRWAKALAACRDFFNALSENGYYELVQATKKNTAEYRKAFRLGYISSDSKEVLMKFRACMLYGSQGSYSWHQWGTWNNVNRHVYSPTEEYAEMFGWSDGTPFRWDVDSLAGKVSGEKGRLFYEYKPVRGGLSKTASRDPRMYENMAVNGMNNYLNWLDESDAKESGNIYELWRGGKDAQFDVVDMDGNVVEKFETGYPTGYGAIKYQLTQNEFWRYNYPQWVSLSLNEMYLMYAEALAQNGNLAEAIAMVDVVRARVGLKSLATCYQSAYGVDLTSDKDLLIEEILRERACELGMSNNRFYDMVRYKRTDWMTRKLHGLAVERLYKNANNKWEERPTTWYGADKNNGMTEPYVFNYRRFELKDGLRTMWGKDKDSDEVRRWLLSPLPQSEIDKGLGLIQNPGW